MEKLTKKKKKLKGRNKRAAQQIMDE